MLFLSIFNDDEIVKKNFNHLNNHLNFTLIRYHRLINDKLFFQQKIGKKDDE